ncbi:rhamnulokinase [Cohnella rhizosphaerae]|uniref:Rhamnulokinase n=1 Tax=Cohnella rhizosphaerae TaxID=1457232 RepID=A0A9X4QWM1_9BACL|nr:rhamnulokinase family protein [Cohnella rhizosphaerae]MDG0813955.1 rhamnulokinase [Cohnella rhizosphaerae]
MLGAFDGSRLQIQELRRFDNTPVRLGGHFYWDFLRLYHELLQGIGQFKKHYGDGLASIAVDTWGVDVGFLDGQGRLLANPYHYRDARNEGMQALAARQLPEEDMYRLTGSYPWQYNTVFQLLATRRYDPVLWEKAETVLWMPDLFNYFLTGAKTSEFTVASTGGLLDPALRSWSEPLLSALQLPDRMLAPLVQPGTRVGALLPAVGAELGMPAVPVIATASHDSAAAVVAVPMEDDSAAFISCGTWSIMGVERAAPMRDPLGLKLSFTNEGGMDGKTRIVKNIMGLWLLQECRRQWAIEGEEASYADMQAWARAEPGGVCFVDPDDPAFLAPPHMPGAIAAYCRETAQPVPRTKGEIVRCIVDSLALKFRQTAENLERLLGRRLGAIHIVGGGVRHRLLCQLTADATGKPVIAGPDEATSAGNLLVQAIGLRRARGPVASAGGGCAILQV